MKPATKSIIGFCLVLLIGLTSVSFADDRAAFAQAHKLLQAKKYSEAYKDFSNLVASASDSKAVPVYLFYKAKAGYYAGLFDKSADDFRRFIELYPQSPYIAYAHFFLGNINYRLAGETMAVQSYIRAYSLSKDTRLDELILKSVETALSTAPPKVYEKISLTSVPETRQCELALALARGLVKQENYQTAASLLGSCTAPEAIALKAQAEKLVRQQAEIGIVLPLSGELQRYGEAILDGAMMMADKYTRETGQKLTPLVYDTKGESVEAARIVRRMAATGAAAVIGPLTSEETAVAAAALSCSDLPLIAPAAGQGGLTDLSLTSFQLQPTLDRQGIKMAEYAFKNLKIDTVAIISPTLPENLRMADAFAHRFTELGGTVLGTEYFRIRETDFGAIISDLKGIASGGKLLDSAIYINENGDTLESKEIPIGIEAIYIPAEAAQLRQLLPQINFYNLNAVYLGGEGWADSSIYDLDRNITKVCYFTSSRIANEVNPVFKKFSSDFFDKYGQAPGYLEALGYDAMSLLCGGLKAGAYTRNSMTRYLTEVKNYNGASGNVSFGENRENVVMPVYTIEGGKPKRVDQ